MTEYNLNFPALFYSLSLGELTNEPTPLHGGHLHRMYTVTSTTGKYAVKALNPQVMLRKEAKQNILLSEKIAQIAAKHIPALPALIFDDMDIPQIDGQYYLIFNWVEGKSLFNEQINSSHCKKIGNILAKLHKIDFKDIPLDTELYLIDKETDWQFYLQKGKEENAVWYDIFKENISFFNQCNKRLINSNKNFPPELINSHGDLDPKNVLWQNDQPLIIDWEAAGAINPMQDLVETALYWSTNGEIDREKFTAFIKGYIEINGKISADWQIILDKGLGSKLGWLEYSLKRSLGIETADQQEQQLGTDHVFGMIELINKYCNTQEKIIDWITKI